MVLRVLSGGGLENAGSLERVESWELENGQGKVLGNAEILELRNVGSHEVLSGQLEIVGS